MKTSARRKVTYTQASSAACRGCVSVDLDTRVAILTGIGSPYTLMNVGVNVSYTFDVFGGIRRQVEAYKAQSEYQRFQLEAAYLTLTANVVTAAVQEASLRGQIAATLELIKDERDQLVIVRNEFQLGGASEADVLAQQHAVGADRSNAAAT